MTKLGRILPYLVVFTTIIDLNIRIVQGFNPVDFRNKLTRKVKSIADESSKDEADKIKTRKDNDLTPHRDLYAIFTIEHVSKTVMQEAKEFTIDNNSPAPDAVITTEHMLIELKDIDCIATRSTVFPDRKKLYLTSPWNQQSDRMEIALPCPQIPKDPVSTRQRRSAEEEIAGIQSQVVITLSHWLHPDGDDDDDDDDGMILEEEARRSRRSINNSSCSNSSCNSTNTPVHGGYGSWTAYSSCTKTCGSGTKTRSRYCNNPSPQNGGNNCSGQPIDTQPCNTNPCIECGGVLTGSEGNFSSPLFGTSNYPSNINCIWNISVPNEYSIVVEFDSFHLEKDKKCYYDYVEFYDGSSDRSNVLERYCGQENIYPVNSTESHMTIKFKSDRDVQKPGFIARWYKVLKVKPSKFKPQRVTLVSSIYNPWRATIKYPVPLGPAFLCSDSVQESYQCYFKDPQMVISRVLTMTVNRTLEYDSSNAIIATFEHILSSQIFPDAYNQGKTCVYWNRDIPGTSYGAWSRKGSSLLSTNLTHTTCKYLQSGSFAVLGNAQAPRPKLRLFTNSYVGLSLGILGSIMAIVNLRYKHLIHSGEKMHIYQAISISFVIIFYILGCHLPVDKHLCGFTAFCMYYFVLATFFWLLLTVLRLHGKFSSLFSGHVRIEVVHFLIGWGIPIFLAGIAGGIEINDEHQHEVCWTAARGGNVWSYAAPIFILIGITTMLLIKLGLPTKDIVENYQYHQMKFRVAKTGMLLLLYMLSWVTGLMVIAQEDFSSQYFFSMFLILMAILLFVFAREEVEDFKKEDERKEEEKETVDDDQILEEKTSELEITEEDIPEKQPKKRRRKRATDGPSERVTVPTLKNLNIYKENGAFVIEA